MPCSSPDITLLKIKSGEHVIASFAIADNPPLSARLVKFTSQILPQPAPVEISVVEFGKFPHSKKCLLGSSGNSHSHIARSPTASGAASSARTGSSAIGAGYAAPAAHFPRCHVVRDRSRQHVERHPCCGEARPCTAAGAVPCRAVCVQVLAGTCAAFIIIRCTRLAKY